MRHERLLTRGSPAPHPRGDRVRHDATGTSTEGDEIAPGLRAVRLLGGGRRYEAHLAWADHLRALVVVKVLRPARRRRRRARGHAAARRMLLRGSRTRCCCARFGAALDGERPHLVLEHIEGPRLSTLIRRYGLNLEQLLPLALNLCSVLHYLAHGGRRAPRRQAAATSSWAASRG